MKQATKDKISAAQRGKRRGKHPTRVLNIDFDVERTEKGVKVTIFNDVGGGGLADFTVSTIKARRLGVALVDAAGGPDLPDEVFLIVENHLDFEGYSKGTRVLGYARSRASGEAYIQSIKPTFSAQTGQFTNRDGTRAFGPDELVRSVQTVSLLGEEVEK